MKAILLFNVIMNTRTKLGTSLIGLSDGEGDAFRHTLWNYRMSQDIGRSEAKKFGDAHERGNAYLQYSRGQEYGAGNSPGSRNMDLHNNHIGRNLQPRNGSE